MCKDRGIPNQNGLFPEQIEILTDGESPKYKIKFKFLEIFGEAFS